MGHGYLSDMRHYTFLNSTRDIGVPRQGPHDGQDEYVLRPGGSLVGHTSRWGRGMWRQSPWPSRHEQDTTWIFVACSIES